MLNTDIEEVIDFMKVNVSLEDESLMKNLISKLKDKGKLHNNYIQLKLLLIILLYIQE